MLFLLQSLVLLFLATGVQAATFLGCSPILVSGAVKLGTTTNVAACEALGVAAGAKVIWVGSTLTTSGCYTSPNSVPGTLTATGGPPTCPILMYGTYYISTTYTLTSCQTLVVTFGSVQSTQQTASECLAACANFQYVVWQPLPVLPSQCYCANIPLPGVPALTCSTATFMVFEHPAWAAASGLARRDTIARQAADQAVLDANPFCPPGLSACNLVGRDGQVTDGYECLNTSTELESCGGCLNGAFKSTYTLPTGVDCTEIDGVNPNGVTCHGGKCEISRCARGYKLVDGTCV